MQRILFIINPKAGTRKKSRIEQEILTHIDSALYDIEIVYTGKPGDGTELAREAADKGYYAAVAVGGDGTVNEVASGLTGSDTALGIIPCGSGDGLALHIGMSRIPSIAVRNINRGKVVTVDHCTVNGRPFFCTCGVGFDALVSLQFTQSGKRGLVTYIEKALQNWAGYSPVSYRLETDDGTIIETKAMLITCANAAQWGNEARIAPHASLSDGFMDVTIVEPFNALQAGPLAVHLMSGTLHWSPLTKMFRCRSILIQRPQDGPVHFDGDPTVMGTELELKVIPQSLKLIVPAKKSKL